MPFTATAFLLRSLLGSILAVVAPVEARCALPKGVDGPPDTVKIGLFVPTGGERAREGLALRRGAEMAVDQANAEGGFQGRPFRLVLGSASASWGAGTRELVRLVYEERVWAVVGAVGGRSAHLAAQIVTRAKGEVVFLTPAATDPSLTRINVPWLFRLAPDDREQAAVLAGEIFDGRRLERVALVVGEGYDCRTAASAFVRVAPQGATIVLPVSRKAEEQRQLVRELGRSQAEGIVLFVRASMAAKIARLLRSFEVSLPLYGPLSLAASEFVREAASAGEGVVLVIPGRLPEASREAFPRNPERRRPLPRTVWESYAFDSVAVVVEAIRRAGLDRPAIRDALACTRAAGLTGPIRFGPGGNRLGGARLGQLQQGRLVALALR